MSGENWGEKTDSEGGRDAIDPVSGVKFCGAVWGGIEVEIALRI